MKTFSSASDGPRFIYRHHPLHSHSFQIMKRGEGVADMVPVADYAVLDLSEEPALSERKIMNLVALLNGREEGLLELGEGLDTRLLYQRIPSDDGRERIVFRTLGHQGISTENALLTLTHAEALS